MPVKDEEVGSWEQLARLIEEAFNDDVEAISRGDRTVPGVRWLFRGETDASRTLIPKIGRIGVRRGAKDGQAVDLSYDPDEEKRMLEVFKKVIPLDLQIVPGNDWEWLAIGRHHELPTRLLDWTPNPFVALWSALQRAGVGGTPVVYVLEAPEEIKEESDGPEKPDEPFEIKKVKLYIPRHIHPRIRAQNGMFTVHPNPCCPFFDPKDPLSGPKNLFNWRFPTGPNGFPHLRVKFMLDQMGFHQGSIYPDLVGMAESVAWRYKWGRL